VGSADIGKDLDCTRLFLYRPGDDKNDDRHTKDIQSLKSPAKPKNSDPEWLSPDIAILSTRVGGTLYCQPSLPDDAVVTLSRTTTERLDIRSWVYWPLRGRVALDGLQYRCIDGDTLFRRKRLAGPARWLRKRKQSGPLSFMWRPLLRLANAIAGGDGAYLRWLLLYTRKYYDPQPYDTLAAALRSMGRDNDATRVLIARAGIRQSRCYGA